MSKKAERLMAFLKLLYRENERVFFFPLMHDPVLNEYTATKKPYPAQIGRICISKYPSSSKWHPPAKALNPISASVGSRTFHKTFDYLNQINELGYDIYLTPNPLTYKRRVKETVREIRYIVLESDDISIEAQQAFLEMIKPNVRVAVFTGNRSIHCYIPLTHPIRNHECLYANQYKRIQHLPDNSPDIVIPDFNEVVEGFKMFLSGHNYPYCESLRSFWGLTRCPYFINHKSGVEADVIYESNATNIGYINDFGVSGHELLEINEVGRVKWERYKGLEPGSVYHYCNQVEPMVHSLDNSPPQKEPKAERLSQETNDAKPGGQFLRDLNAYEELKISGIPKRGVRISLHKVMFTATRLFDWNDDKLGLEWRNIVSINPRNIGFGIDDAVDDLLREWDIEKNRTFRFWTPAQATLPDASTTHKDNVRIKLNAWGCKKARSASNLIIKLLYPTIRKALVPCLRGTVAIQAKEIWKACNGNVNKEMIQWLDEKNIYGSRIRVMSLKKEAGCGL